MNPQCIKISSKSMDRTLKSKRDSIQPCPYKILRTFIKARKRIQPRNGPFFVFKDGSAVMAENFRKILRQAIKKEGFNDNLYNSHSLHIGRSCDLQSAGVSVETIRKLGRWTSNCVYKYLKD